jgi:hypothetical protein
MIAGIAGITLLVILLFIALIFFSIRQRRQRKLSRKAAYARVTLDEGEDWNLEPYRPPSLHGDALGVYAAITSPTHQGPSQSSHPDDATTTPLPTSRDSWHDTPPTPAARKTQDP